MFLHPFEIEPIRSRLGIWLLRSLIAKYLLALDKCLRVGKEKLAFQSLTERMLHQLRVKNSGVSYTFWSKPIGFALAQVSQS